MASTKRQHPRTGPQPRPRPGAFAAWCAALGIPLAEVAKRLGISPQSVSNLRSGRRPPGLKLANRIAKVSGGQVPTTSWEAKR